MSVLVLNQVIKRAMTIVSSKLNDTTHEQPIFTFNGATYRDGDKINVTLLDEEETVVLHDATLGIGPDSDESDYLIVAAMYTMLSVNKTASTRSECRLFGLVPLQYNTPPGHYAWCFGKIIDGVFKPNKAYFIPDTLEHTNKLDSVEIF